MTPEEAVLDPQSSVGWQVRSCHPYGYHSGTWALVVGISVVNGRDCWDVVFPNGDVDTWVISDRAGEYELKPASD